MRIWIYTEDDKYSIATSGSDVDAEDVIERHGYDPDVVDWRVENS